MVRAQSEREKRAALTIESYYKRYREVGGGRGGGGGREERVGRGGRRGRGGNGGYLDDLDNAQVRGVCAAQGYLIPW